MSEQIIQLLIMEKNRLDRAIEALQGSSETVDVYDDPTMPEWVRPKAKVAATPKRKVFSAATRRKMAEGQKRRWAAINAAKAEVVAPKRSKEKSAILAAIAPPEDAEFKAKMSVAMKASWAKRKKATAKLGVK
jgi:hypothetical protein